MQVTLHPTVYFQLAEGNQLVGLSQFGQRVPWYRKRQDVTGPERAE